jgi:hypothetical protein
MQENSVIIEKMAYSSLEGQNDSLLFLVEKKDEHVGYVSIL